MIMAKLSSSSVIEEGEFALKKQVYISGPLLHVGEDKKVLYEQIGRIVSELGFEPYIPHQHTDPIQNAEYTPEDVYSIDKTQVQRSCLLIAYVGVPSLGVGIEIEMAAEKNIPIILVYESTVSVSKMARGARSVRYYVPNNHRLFENILKSAIFQISP